MTGRSQQQRPGAEATGAADGIGTSIPGTPDHEMCHWCGRYERHRDPDRSEPWSACLHCLRAFAAMDRRRHQADLRLPPLDLTLPQQRSAASLDVGPAGVAS